MFYLFLQILNWARFIERASAAQKGKAPIELREWWAKFTVISSVKTDFQTGEIWSEFPKAETVSGALQLFAARWPDGFLLDSETSIAKIQFPSAEISQKLFRWFVQFERENLGMEKDLEFPELIIPRWILNIYCSPSDFVVGSGDSRNSLTRVLIGKDAFVNWMDNFNLRESGQPPIPTLTQFTNDINWSNLFSLTYPSSVVVEVVGQDGVMKLAMVGIGGAEVLQERYSSNFNSGGGIWNVWSTRQIVCVSGNDSEPGKLIVGGREKGVVIPFS